MCIQHSPRCNSFSVVAQWCDAICIKIINNAFNAQYQMVLSLLLNTIIIFINVIITYRQHPAVYTMPAPHDVREYTTRKNRPARFMFPFLFSLLFVIVHSALCVIVAAVFVIAERGEGECWHNRRHKTAFIFSHSCIGDGLLADLIRCMFWLNGEMLPSLLPLCPALLCRSFVRRIFISRSLNLCM